MVDALALGASEATHGGSSPLPGTKTVEPRARLWAITVFDEGGTRK